MKPIIGFIGFNFGLVVFSSFMKRNICGRPNKPLESITKSNGTDKSRIIYLFILYLHIDYYQVGLNGPNKAKSQFVWPNEFYVKPCGAQQNGLFPYNFAFAIKFSVEQSQKSSARRGWLGLGIHFRMGI